MLEITRFHIEQTPGYEHWLNANGIAAKDLETLEDWSQLPPIFANFFKQHLLLSPTGEDALELTSSGTSGQKAACVMTRAAWVRRSTWSSGSLRSTAGLHRIRPAITCC
jgi:phenylacetate-coenzyme A ligase PaaK-like adenylate-forming protein